MAWVPRYKIVAGLLAGGVIPVEESLQDLYDFPSATKQSVSNVRFAQRLDFANDNWSGGGASCYDELLEHAMAAYESGNLGEWYLLAEIEVEKPEGAQYYKETYVIDIRDETGCGYRENTVTVSGNEYHCKWFLAQWAFRVQRRQYDTPYSDYIPTNLSANGTRSFGLGCKIVQGSADDVYYAFTGVWAWDRIVLSLGKFVSSDDKECFGVAMFGWRDAIPTRNMPNPNPDNRRSFGIIGQVIEWLDTLYGEFTPEVIIDPNDEDPPEDGPGKGGGGGGEGDHNLPDGPVQIPPLPSLGSCSPSWLRTYMMDKEDIDEFGEELVDPTLMQQLKAYFADPLDAIVGITLCPCIPSGPRYQYTPKVHGTPSYEFSRSFTAIGSQFGVVNCGFVDMAPYWDNCFDFDPYTKISIFLPFIGFREINADEVMGGKIGVVYHVDVVTGDCVAFITASAPSESIYGPMPEKVIGEHHGNCGVQVPIGRVSHDAAVSAGLNLMTTFAGLAVGAAAGYAGLASPENISESQVASQLSSSAMTAVEGLKTKVERAGALGGNAGYMGNRKPYLIRQIPRQSKPNNYKQICGYPCNKEGPLSNFETGTLACVEDIQLNNIPAMETEREEIIQFLKGGVIL